MVNRSDSGQESAEAAGGTHGDVVSALRVESLRIEEDCTLSSKRHFNTADIWKWCHYGLGVLAALAAAGAGASALGEETLAAGVLGAASAFLSALMTFLKPGETSAVHKGVGDKYLSLKNDARIFRTVLLIHAGEDQDSLISQLAELSDRRNSLNESSPVTPRWAFEKARKGVEQGEATHAVDKETNRVGS